ncbi:TIGR02099 family protein [Prodigiosinella confusarubida]|uniref:TIGR02099 family protein n=1 Tax=Serratia sp. (strain ATCC 39006) TaxID=104623 RepID=A0A2I5T1P2_SERS3|nr:AsmA2 domain-containing protein YhdP [Serratia sp. ATCC 39006]AUG98487.1 TIGR02099 family protein [Serratia sp. ATCC 39006]AUH02802.1 TIGR02099 family protein [Serratia sp. ATCC 39006]
MRRLPGILLATGATLIVLCALVVSGLRVVLPQLDYFRPQVVAWAQSVTGIPLEVGALRGSWETFGPTLEIQNFSANGPDADWQSERITLALDVWQSLLHLRWQFRDLTFYHMHLDVKTPLNAQHQGNLLEPGRLSDLFLRQFDHFDLRDSHITFLTPSGTHAELSIPQLTWLNRNNRHRAEGLISLSSFNGQHGVVQMRMDLRDNQGWLDNGTVYLQADNIDMKPWLGRWIRSNTGLESADFSLAAWLNVREGSIYSGDLLLNKGTASWREGENAHRLSIDNMTVHVSRRKNGWQVEVPALTMSTDGVLWSKGRLSALWLPKSDAMLGPDHQSELRIRASNLDLERFSPLLPLLATATPTLEQRWLALQPKGRLTALALDIPLLQPEKTRFQVKWQDVSWQNWQLIPGVNHFSGSASGSIARGQVGLSLKQSVLPYPNMFRAPLEIGQASGTINWRDDDQGWELWAQGLDVRAKSLWANGDFHYRQPAKGKPRLDILSGLRLTDAADAWRYYPEPFMGKPLVDYLSSALKAGRVDNGTLIFAGNPQDFPFEHHEGQFQVWVPVKNAIFEFQPGWPALTEQDITLNFLNNGLWMSAPHAWLGKVEGTNISAIIPDYAKEQLLVNGDLHGPGEEVRHYFNQTPMKSSLGSALDALQIGGMVNGSLHLDIPLDVGDVQASGDVVLNDNTLLIKPLDTTLENLTGQFHYNNGALVSNNLQANWLGQPISVNFTTEEQAKAFQINVGLQGDWQASRLSGMPTPLVSALSGSANWKSTVAVSLPYKGDASYDVDLQTNFKGVSSHLPPPLNKTAGTALPLHVTVKGDVSGFMFNGSLGKAQRFISQWQLHDSALTLMRGAWQNNAKVVPRLPKAASLMLDVPALDGEGWLGLLPGIHASLSGTSNSSNFHWPALVILKTPELNILGQRWHDLVLTKENRISSEEVGIKGQEIDGKIDIPNRGAWQSDIRYLYYNPQWKSDDATNPIALAEKKSPLNDPAIKLEDWPAIQVNCRECWILGQNMGRIQGALQPERNKLLLSDGVIDTGKSRLTINGSWQESSKGVRTAVKGRLSGDSLTKNIAWFGVKTPLRAGEFSVDYDLYWRGTPWEPDIPSLSGILKTHIGKGEITNVSTGQAGQLLRLVSFDALLRKLQFDFRDTFSEGFYFDSINSTAWIKEGVLHTDNLLVDGLAADIAMKGDVDLVKHQIAMEAVVAPEISATVGVATAFAVNPLIGAAVFAASKALAPLWNKISLIRYQISGSLDQPKIQEVLREPQKTKPAEAAVR